MPETHCKGPVWRGIGLGGWGWVQALNCLAPACHLLLALPGTSNRIHGRKFTRGSNQILFSFGQDSTQNNPQNNLSTGTLPTSHVPNLTDERSYTSTDKQQSRSIKLDATTIGQGLVVGPKNRYLRIRHKCQCELSTVAAKPLHRLAGMRARTELRMPASEQACMLS
jgi:hypothetical protein